MSPRILPTEQAKRQANGSMQTSLQESRVRSSPSRVACTHTHMTRVYGANECQICHKPPALGFLYVCEQDSIQDTPMEHKSRLPVSKSNYRRRLQKENPQVPVSLQLELLGFSSSIVRAAKEGHYTLDQIEIMKAQKLNLKKTIKKTLQENSNHQAKCTSPPLDVQMDRAGSAQIQPLSIQPGAETSKNEQRQEHKKKLAVDKFRPLPAIPQVDHTDFKEKEESCTFHVCHNCRPPFRDRSFHSFESVYTGETPPVKDWDSAYMRVAPVSIMKTIGLKEYPDIRSGLAPAKKDTPSPNTELDASGPNARLDIETKPNGSEPAQPTQDANPANEAPHSPAAEDCESLHQIQKHISTQDLKEIIEKASGNSPVASVRNAVRNAEIAYYQEQERIEQEIQAQTSATIKPRPSTFGFHSTLAKDLRKIVEQAHRDVRKSPTIAQDPMTGLTADIIQRIRGAYRRGNSEVFDLPLWKALSSAIQSYAMRVRLPGKDGEDGLEEEGKDKDIKPSNKAAKGKDKGLRIVIEEVDAGVDEALGEEEKKAGADDPFVPAMITEESALLSAPDVISPRCDEATHWTW